LSAELHDVDVLVVGGGVIGLSCARSLTLRGLSVCLVERHPKLGVEVSSHNSEVIHAGIYYKGKPLKARHCRLGRDLLYSFAAEYDVPHRRCGKLIVACSSAETEKLEGIRKSAEENDVPLTYLSLNEIRDRTFHPGIVAALWSPETGIVNSHVFMQKLEALAVERGAMVLYRHKLEAVEGHDGSGWICQIKDPHGEPVRLRARAFVNAAGMASALVARKFFLEPHVEIRPCRGRYFGMASRYQGKYPHLIYPLPDPRGGLGVHLTFDMGGRCRLGPDVDWVSSDDMSVFEKNHDGLYAFDSPHDGLQREFWRAGLRIIEALKEEDLSPDYVGVRPKLFVDGRAHDDFSIHRGAHGDIHLLGIESPGLTAALSIAEEVERALL
jgi:L-2-hydroxyglutarate oxidase LhgO